MEATYQIDSLMPRTSKNNMPCNSDCPVRATADIIEHKWSTLIIRDLLGGKKRFSELERSLTPISPKVLSERLKELESKRIICRTIYPTIPPMTEYELTPLGRELAVVIRAMQNFGTLLLAHRPLTETPSHGPERPSPSAP